MYIFVDNKQYSPLPPSFTEKVTFISILSLILLVGLTANIFVILWIAKGKPKRTG